MMKSAKEEFKMNDINNGTFNIESLALEVITNPAPESCKEIAKLLSNLPVKSWVHRQLPTKEQDQAFEMMKEKSLSPTPEEIKFIADVCCGKYHRIRRGNWNWPQFDKGKELYQQFYDLILAKYFASPSPIEKQDGIILNAACALKSAEIQRPITNKSSKPSTCNDSNGNWYS